MREEIEKIWQLDIKNPQQQDVVFVINRIKEFEKKRNPKEHRNPNDIFCYGNCGNFHKFLKQVFGELAIPKGIFMGLSKSPYHIITAINQMYYDVTGAYENERHVLNNHPILEEEKYSGFRDFRIDDVTAEQIEKCCTNYSLVVNSKGEDLMPEERKRERKRMETTEVGVENLLSTLSMNTNTKQIKEHLKSLKGR